MDQLSLTDGTRKQKHDQGVCSGTSEIQDAFYPRENDGLKQGVEAAKGFGEQLLLNDGSIQQSQGSGSSSTSQLGDPRNFSRRAVSHAQVLAEYEKLLTSGRIYNESRGVNHKNEFEESSEESVDDPPDYRVEEVPEYEVTAMESTSPQPMRVSSERQAARQVFDSAKTDPAMQTGSLAKPVSAKPDASTDAVQQALTRRMNSITTKNSERVVRSKIETSIDNNCESMDDKEAAAVRRAKVASTVAQPTLIGVRNGMQGAQHTFTEERRECRQNAGQASENRRQSAGQHEKELNIQKKSFKKHTEKKMQVSSSAEVSNQSKKLVAAKTRVSKKTRNSGTFVYLPGVGEMALNCLRTDLRILLVRRCCNS